MSRALWITGLSLMVAPFLLATIMFAGADGFDGVIGALMFTFVIGPILFIIGLVLLIVGLARGDGGQSQQQQVVVYADGSRSCPHCGAGLDNGQRFCSGCGTGV